MKKIFSPKAAFNFAYLLVCLSLLAFDFPDAEGWYKAGSNPKAYDMGMDKGAGIDGKNAATIKSVNKKVKGFGTLMQDILPDKYLGKRIRLSGFVKSIDVSNKAGLWMRVDQEKPNGPLSFDNMMDRPIKGNTDWKKYEVVLDVPLNSTLIAYGALLVGSGQIWFDNLSIEVVDSSLRTTDNSKNRMPKEVPLNLDFEK